MQLFEVKSILEKNGIHVSTGQLEQLDCYVKILIEKNKSINLISRKDIGHIWERHILHSISLLFYLDLPDGIRILDLGTGGGLPGIPLKILKPQIEMDLVDSIQKKVSAVQEFINILKLKNISALCKRAESLNKKYNLIVSRAVTDLPQLFKWSKNLLDTSEAFSIIEKVNNQTFNSPLIISYKGGKLDNEIKKLKLYSQNLLTFTINISIKGIKEGLLVDKKLILVKIK
ncbi:MAG: rRNA small subunit 7-methylguanosine (m7G) methyltransferase GidB [Ignavibacteriae bacterium]|nr:MAG: rRNA small subunit 7-methylguanosine (m7G) methyltransferase GidB [Ignavibacteriota bacterium]